jgi:hypothetical protein
VILLRRIDGALVLSAWELACHVSPTGPLQVNRHSRLSVNARQGPVLTPLSGTQRARRRVSGRQAQPDVAANSTATSATVLRIPSVMIFAIFCKRTFVVAFIGVSFAVASCCSS